MRTAGWHPLGRSMGIVGELREMLVDREASGVLLGHGVVKKLAGHD